MPRLDGEVALVGQHNNLLARMTLEEVFEWDRAREARLAYGTNDLRHPLITEMNSWGELCVAGRVRVFALPRYHDFRSLRLTPAQVRGRLAGLGCHNVVAFQTRNPLQHAHEELTERAEGLLTPQSGRMRQVPQHRVRRPRGGHGKGVGAEAR